MEDLKRCPFCGSENVGLAIESGDGWFWISCKDCEGSGGTAGDIDGARELWNRRADNEQL